MSKQTFLQGTLILIAASMITRFLGFVNRIILARIMGQEGVGLFMMAMPTLFLAIAVTQFGLPVAISKRVAEADAKNDQTLIKRIVVVSLVITASVSTIFVGILLGLAPIIAEKLLTDQRVIYPLMAIAPIIPIMAVAAVLRGYFQGKQNMKPQSFSQVIEQIIRIGCTAYLIKLFLPYGIEFAALGAMLSVILGEFCSLLYMLFQFKRKKTIQVRKQFFKGLEKWRDTIRALFSIALPATGSRLISSITHFLEPILTAQSLALAGVTAAVATSQYGELTGYALPLLFLPTFITHSLSTALLPSVSEASARGKQAFVHYRILQAVRLSYASGVIATVVLVIFASPILQFMYGTDSAARFIILMAPFYLLMYIQTPLSTALHALDIAKAAMWNSIIGSLVKITVLVMLASNASFGIMGVALAMAVSTVLVTLLHLATLMKTQQFRIPLAELAKMVLLGLLTWLTAKVLSDLFAAAVNQLPVLLFLLIVLMAIYSFFLFILGFVSLTDIRQLIARRKK